MFGCVYFFRLFFLVLVYVGCQELEQLLELQDIITSQWAQVH